VPGCPSTARPTPAATPPVTPTPGQEISPTPDPNAKESNGNIITDIVDGIVGIFGGGTAKESAAPTPSGSAGASARAASPTPTASGGQQSRPGCAQPNQPKPGAKQPVPKAGKPAPLIATDEDQPPVAKVPSRLTGSKVTMSKLRLAGIVELPTEGGGTLRALKFSMSRAVTDDFTLDVPGKPGLLFKTKALTVDGDVAFYATRFVGRIPVLGIKVTLTPDLPIPPDGIPITVPFDVVFDDPDMQLAYVQCHTLTAKPKLDLTLP
ncbi:hypothetical protein ACFQ0D_07905, partial [Micromonospora zhanjiangensis]